MSDISARRPAVGLPSPGQRAVLIGLAAAGVFLIDLAVPPERGDGALYLGLVLLGWWLTRPVQIVALAGAASALLLIGQAWPVVMYGEAPGAPLAAAPALLALWATAALLVSARRRTERLRRDCDELSAHLAAARTHAEVAARSAAQVLGGISHELRTPLNAIIGFSEIARSELLGPIGSARYREYMNDINRSGQHLLELVEKLLDLARIEAGKVELREEVLDVRALVHACLGEFALRAAARGIALEAIVAPDAPPLRADGERLSQALSHLLDNALACTPKGGRVRLSAWASPGAGYVLQVSDTGTGMALHEIPRALAPFGQIENPLRRAAGTGLGLPLVKALVELHAGSLDLQSKPGLGTTATLRLPAERVPDQARAA